MKKTNSFLISNYRMAREHLSDWYHGALHALDQSYQVSTPILQITWHGSRATWTDHHSTNHLTNHSTNQPIIQPINHSSIHTFITFIHYQAQERFILSSTFITQFYTILPGLEVDKYLKFETFPSNQFIHLLIVRFHFISYLYGKLDKNRQLYWLLISVANFRHHSLNMQL